MPLNSTVRNAEVMKNTVVESAIGPIAKLVCKTWNPTKKGSPPLEVVFSATVFKPTDEIIALANGDKINIGMGDRPALTKIDSNPNVVQVRKNDLGDADAKTYPSRFVEITCFGELVELVEKKDKTRTQRPMPESAPTDFDDDDLLF